MRVAVTGSTGLIGSALTAALSEAGHDVVRLVRPGSKVDGIAWDPAAGTIDAAGLEGVGAVVNLAGRSIGQRRWTDEEKALVRSSRVDTTGLLAVAIASLSSPPSVLLSASAVGVYGDRGDRVLDEHASPGVGFFPDVCVAWESATAPAAEAGIRVVNLRSGMVVAGSGGALGRIQAPFGPPWLSPYRWGLGGWIGSGRSWWPWISLRDEVRAILHLLDSGLAGPVNLVSPEPARNKVFMKAVGRALRRPVWLPIPHVVLRLVLGSELAEATLFDSMRVIPGRLRGDGFTWLDGDLEDTIRAAISAGQS